MVEMNATNRPASMAAVYQELQGIEAQLVRKTPLPPTRSTHTAAAVSKQRMLSPSQIPARSQPSKKISRRAVIIGMAALGLAVAGGGMELWVFAPHPLYTYGGHSENVNAVTWSPDGYRIASGSDDGTAQAWDAEDGGHVFSYRGHFGYAVRALAWSPTSARIASGGADGTVQVWNVADGNNVYTYRGHTQYVDINSVAWSPGGTRIVSGSDDGTAQVWDAEDGGHAYMYHGHSDYYLGHAITHAAVNSVTWSPGGTRIASGSSDKTVQVWQDEG